MPVLDNFYIKLSCLLRKCFPKFYCRYFEKTSFVKFSISGFMAGFIDLVLLFLFYGLFKWGIVLSTSLAFLFSFLFSFYLQRVWTFEKKEEKKVPRQLLLYMLNAFLSLNINGFGMHFLTNEVGVWYLISQIIVNFCLGILNFFIYKYIIFREDDEINCEQEQID